jgi:hypothetical protein
MMLKCGLGGEEQSDQLIFVCHHCGMPVCDAHGWVVLADDAFDDSHQPVPRAAMHCRDCVEDYHKNAHKQHGWLAPASSK